MQVGKRARPWVKGAEPTRRNYIFSGCGTGLPNEPCARDTANGPGSASSTWREGGIGSNFNAMNEANSHAEKRSDGVGELPRIAGVEVAEAQGDSMSMERKQNTTAAPTDEAYFVSAADLADKIISLMQRGLNPMQLSNSAWLLIHRRTERC
jgi:hypothetical protein